jgi:hypothetical protein
MKIHYRNITCNTNLLITGNVHYITLLCFLVASGANLWYKTPVNWRGLALCQCMLTEKLPSLNVLISSISLVDLSLWSESALESDRHSTASWIFCLSWNLWAYWMLQIEPYWDVYLPPHPCHQYQQIPAKCNKQTINKCICKNLWNHKRWEETE